MSHRDAMRRSIQYQFVADTLQSRYAKLQSFIFAHKVGGGVDG